MNSPEKYDPMDYVLEEFIRDGFTYGDTIPREWFEEKFGLEPPKTIHDYKRHQITYAAMLGEFRNKLLACCKMALKTSSGVGQEVVRSDEQVAWALCEVKNAILRETEKARFRVANIRLENLTLEEKRDAADAMARLSCFVRKTARSLP